MVHYVLIDRTVELCSTEAGSVSSFASTGQLIDGFGLLLDLLTVKKICLNL